MLEKLAQIEKNYAELTEQISSPRSTSDMKPTPGDETAQHLGEIVEKIRAVRKMRKTCRAAQDLLDLADDDEMREMANMEIAEIGEKLPTAEEQLKFLLLPKDPNDEKNVILEIRAGTGGDEATLFAAEVLRMYAAMPSVRAWKMEIMDASDTGVGGIKEAFCDDRGRQGLFQASLRIRRPSRPARAADRDERPHSTPRPLRSPSCPRPKRWTFTSIPKTCVWIISARPGPRTIG